MSDTGSSLSAEESWSCEALVVVIVPSVLRLPLYCAWIGVPTFESGYSVSL